MQATDEIRHLLATSRTIAVVGLSDKPQRPSHGVAAYLQRQGYRIVPINPNRVPGRILGETVYARLQDVPFAVDLVDVFRRTEEVLPIAHDAVAIGARGFWQQVGVRNVQAAEVARAAGLVSVMDRCSKVEHARLIGAARRS
jgi:predicted CoA-binding protein